MSTLWLNCNDNPITYNKKNYLLRAAKRLNFDNVKDIKIKDYEYMKKEYVLNIEPYTYISGKKWTGIWEIDLLLARDERELKRWEEANDIFIAIEFIPLGFEKFLDKIRILSEACDPELHKHLDIKRKYDFILCGTWDQAVWSERRRLIELLAKTYSFHNFGKDFAPDDYVKILNTARVQFVRSMGTKHGQGEIAQRFYDALAIGPCLVNYQSDLDRLNLIEGFDYYSYKSDNELLEKMEILIKAPNIADRMAKAGRQKALVYHTYDNRLLTLIKFLKHKYAFNNDNEQ